MEVIEKAPEAVVATPAVEAPRADTPDWYVLLEEAVKEPGQLAEAHKFFHQYSLANRWLASTQLRAMGLPLTPINTFKGWQNADRMVMKGQKASISLIMPVPVYGKKKAEDGAAAPAKGKAAKGKATVPAADEKSGSSTFTRFMLRRYWFALSQTEGEEFNPEKVERGLWNLTAALDFMEVKEVSFEFNGVGDVQRLGWASQNAIAVSPLATHQEFGRLRELARILLNHLSPTPPKSVPEDPELREVEAEAAAYLVAATLGFSGLAESRSRLQSYLTGGTGMRIPDRNAHRAFSAADKLINAGYC